MASEKHEKLNYIGKVVRALVTSRKPPVEMRSILKDYYDVEGEGIPFRQMGYNTAVDLLNDTGEFTFRSFNDVLCITAKFSEKTEHIASMIRNQKRSKSSSLNFTRPGPRKPPTRSTFGAGGYPQYNRYQQSLQPRFVSGSQIRTNLNQSVNRVKLNYGNNTIPLTQVAVGTTVPQINSTGILRKKNEVLQRQEEELKRKQDILEKNIKDLEHKTKKTEELMKQRERVIEKQLKELDEKQIKLEQEQQEKIALLIDQRIKDLQKEKLQEKKNRQEQQNLIKDAVPKHKSSTEHKRNGDITANNNDHINFKISMDKKNIDVPMSGRVNNNSTTTTNGKINKNNNCVDLRDVLNAKYKVKQEQQQQQQQQVHNPLEKEEQQQQQQSLLQKKITGLKLTTDDVQHSTKKHMRPILGQANGGQTQQQPQSQNHRQYTPLTPPHQQPTKQQNQSFAAIERDSVAAKNSGSVRTVVSSVQNRLKVFVPNNTAILTPPNTPDQLRTQPKVKESKSSAGAVYRFDSNEDPIISIEQYCLARHSAPPEYSYFEKNGIFQCRVRIMDLIFSSYPFNLTDKASAKARCAEIALEKLRALESSNLPQCNLSNEELEQLIYDTLISHSNGVITKNMDQWFESTFNQKLPRHWWSIVERSNKFKIENCLGNHSILYPKTNYTADVAATQVKCTTPIVPTIGTGDYLGTSTLPPIKLPWENKNWSLSITHCTSTVEVWARLFGDDYSDRFEKLTNHLEKHMATTKNMHAQNIQLNHIYIVCCVKQWHRVRVDDLDIEKGIAYCFFVDFGDSDTFAIGDLFVCPSEFMLLPAQAVCFALYGLDGSADNPHAGVILDAALAQKSLVAKICTSESDFNTNDGNAQGRALIPGGPVRIAQIQVVLFDTSDDDDINLNELLIEQIFDEVPLPKLQLDLKSNPVMVSHVSDNGDLFLIIPNDDWKYVQRLIAITVGSKFQKIKNATYFNLNSDNMFLICDSTSNPNIATTWYRGMLTEKPHSESDEAFDIYYVDDGRMRSTHISKIFQLEPLSMALIKFPPQAIRVQLHDIPPVTINIVARLRGLLPPKCEALVKVNEMVNDVPSVTVFTRGQTGAFCAVNDTIRIEHELESLDPKTKGGADGDALNKNDSNVSSLRKRTDSHSSNKSNNSLVGSVKLSPNNKLPTLKEFEAIPAVNAYFEVRVSYSANPTFFVVQPYKEYPTLSKLMLQLQVYCENTDFVSPKSVTIGHAYATKNKTDNFYHRIVVLQSYGETLRVKYVDFGDEAVVLSSQLIELTPELRQLPKMAVHAKLHGINDTKAEWSKEDCVRFRELTLGKKFIAIVHKVSYDDPIAQKAALLSLELIDTSTSEDVRIHELFLNEKSTV